MVNRLSRESSPYLLQHADNPVDWYPWGAQALEKARTEDKPIFLSIGYSACHWCHVMERESFEDEQTAAVLNDRFVSVKVDREERPDLDAVYMEAVQALTGHGGWPLSIWLTPDGTPFFGGTYYPPVPRRGMPSFLQVLLAVSDAWFTRRDDLTRTAAAVREHLAADLRDGPGGGTAPGFTEILAGAAGELSGTIDRAHGGWGGAPKFPQASALEFLLALLSLEDRRDLRTGVQLTLDAMAAGGIYDQLGGGFHRYSTDGNWLVPHFEKMLYDNAQLARSYLHAWLLLERPRYRTVVIETLDYLLREMRHPRGGFFSAQDADTEEGEGAYFTWTLDEVRAALPAHQATAFERAYGLTAGGNFEGRNILHLPSGAEPGGAPDREGGGRSGSGGDAAAPPAAAGERTDEALAAARITLLRLRETRPRPARDEKVLTGWNGLVLAALADAAVALPSPAYREAAEQLGRFILTELGGETGLVHSWKDGILSGPAFLDDYACVADGLLALYRCTLDERWFVAARHLVDDLTGRFRRPAGGFYDTGSEHETLIARPRATFDSPTPSGNSMAATVLLQMAAYTGEDRYRSAAEETLAASAATATAAPVMCGQWLTAALVLVEGAIEAALVGDFADPVGVALLAALRDAYRPLVVYGARRPGRKSEVPLLGGREPGVGVAAAAWVCRHSTCSPATSDPTELSRLLEARV